jgi:hypothetical protein
MVYAFECERCQLKVYSVSPRRERGCPVCSQPMTAVPLSERRSAPTPPPQAAPSGNG